MLHAGGWEEQPVYFARAGYPGVAKLRKVLESASKSDWAGFQIFYAMRESEVRGSTGLDLVESMLAVFREVTPAMNLCMQIELAGARRNKRPAAGFVEIQGGLPMKPILAVCCALILVCAAVLTVRAGAQPAIMVASPQFVTVRNGGPRPEPDSPVERLRPSYGRPDYCRRILPGHIRFL